MPSPDPRSTAKKTWPRRAALALLSATGFALLACGGGGGSPAALTVARLRNQTEIQGIPVTFQATAAGGTQPYAYRWTKDGSSTPLGTAASLTVTPASPAESGTYRVQVTDAAGATATSSGALTVTPEVDAADMRFAFVNDTGGAYPSSQIYLHILYKQGDLHHYVKPSGNTWTPHAISVDDLTAEGHLSKGGHNYANYSFTLEQAQYLDVPRAMLMDGTRIYISVGSPIYFGVNPGPALVEPAPWTASDPNADVVLDWIEIALKGGAWNGNTGQVDQFGIPLVLGLQDWSDRTHTKGPVGVTAARKDVFAAFAASMPAEYQGLIQVVGGKQVRIYSPGHGILEGTTPSLATHFQQYIDDMWNLYTPSHELSFTLAGATQYTGHVEGDAFVFRKGASASYDYRIAAKPDSLMVFLCNARLAEGADDDKNVQKIVAAMLNRHVLDHPTQWEEPEHYYRTAPYNDFAAFWHPLSLGEKAYGFAYDDVADQSSSLSTETPLQMKVNVGWD